MLGVENYLGNEGFMAVKILMNFSTLLFISFGSIKQVKILSSAWVRVLTYTESWTNLQRQKPRSSVKRDNLQEV